MTTITITREQLDDIKSPAGSTVAIFGLLELINSTIEGGGRVIIEGYDGNTEDVLNNLIDLNRWREQNRNWLPPED